MAQKILVAYATWAGSTRSIAEAIGQAFRDQGVEADVRPATEVTDLSPYDAVVIGSGIHHGRVRRHMPQFVRKHRRALSAMPVAYFCGCAAMSEDTEENRSTAGAYLDKLRRRVPKVEPVGVGLFGGAALTEGEDFEKLGAFLKMVVEGMAEEEQEDPRNWEAIRAWVVELLPKL